ncbi:LacI family DNA-binding transcriptional regulator [Paenibacillus sp. 32352]|uniref:LacI family DNA-binding transcriptional regulator n=1 Tax=Paenibacillus sp. 32352 TaxID=1969111 RepID=UPI0009ADF046|nr:LacI family DNA-binding transcriptional regulator [Paenibacillus sp. 32352]
MANLQDIATKAGVSKVTVSKVINNYESVAPATREKVHKALREMNLQASDLKRSKDSSMMIGMLMPLGDMTGNRFSMGILAGAEEKALEKDYFIVIGNTVSMEREAKVVAKMLQRDVDGLILLSVNAELDGKHLDDLIQNKVPVVLVDQRLKDFPAHVVRGDNFAAAIKLIDHLVELGHQRIACITLNPARSTHADRVKGYRTGLMNAGLKESKEYYKIVGNGVTSYEATRSLLVQENRPTALFVAQPSMLMNVLRAVQEYGLRVPEDISIVGFDDQYAVLPEEYRSFFTSINQSARLIGSIAIEILCQQMNDASLEYQEIILPGALTVRKSTAPAPAI